MKHLTQRVAWHQHAWDGTVCAEPRENAFCLALDRIHEERDDEHEATLAGRHWSVLDAKALPPCKAEAAAFMSKDEWTREVSTRIRRSPRHPPHTGISCLRRLPSRPTPRSRSRSTACS